MNLLADIEDGIHRLLALAPYQQEPSSHAPSLLSLFQQELAMASERSPAFRNYVAHWPRHFSAAQTLAELPYLPVGLFKAERPLAFVEPGAVVRTLRSSATRSQTPSRVVLDAPTAKRMTKGVTTIIRDFIGPARRPYLVIDTAETLSGHAELGARAAAVQGLRTFATEVVCCLKNDAAGEPALDLELLRSCAAAWKQAQVLVYGFTYIIWDHLVRPLQTLGVSLDLAGATVLHSGGWKRLESLSVTKDVFNHGVAEVLGCAPQRVIDFYGMAENVGVVYPDCDYGCKHVPAFGEVLVRDPRTLAPVAPGERGLVQVCSVLPTSFPGFLVLTEDLAELVSHDGCRCGRRGTAFRFAGRVPQAETRGCGNVVLRSNSRSG